MKSRALLPRGQLPVHAPLKRNEGYFFGAPRKRSLCTEKIKAAASRKRRKIKKSKRQMLAKWVTCTFTKKNELQMFKKTFGTIISNVDSLGACSPLSWIFFYILQPLHPGASHQVDPVPAPSTQCLEPETFITTCACTVTLDPIEVWSQSYGLMETILGCCLGYFFGGGMKTYPILGGDSFSKITMIHKDPGTLNNQDSMETIVLSCTYCWWKKFQTTTSNL